jgi:hypothetical protein
VCALATTCLAVAVAAALVAPGASATPAAGRDPDTPVDVSDARLSPMPVGNGVPQRSATTADSRAPLPAGYVETELLVEGTAAVFTGPATETAEVASEGHAFATRLLVRAPADPSDFSGSVWLEPLNTTGGGDADVIWGSIAPLIEERGDAWVGVTVRAGQVERLKAFDPVRYAGIDLAENAFAWDILRQVGTLLKTNSENSPIGELPVRHLYMGGYSQSGVDAATFTLAIHDLTRLRNGAPVYDGYLVGAREANLAPLQSGDTIIPKFEHGRIRNVDVPTVSIEPQSDVEGFSVEVPTSLAQSEGVAGADEVTTPTFTYTTPGGATVRRPDSDRKDDRYRSYEIAGASHGSGGSPECVGSSSFPIGLFTRAAAANLARWAEGDGAAPRGKRIELATRGDVSDAEPDEYGNAVGGVRSPFVDVPLSHFEVHSGPAPTCKLKGVETLLAADVLTERYGDAQQYMNEFIKSLEKTIDAGFLLELDRQAILDAQELRATEAFGAGAS